MASTPAAQDGDKAPYKAPNSEVVGSLVHTLVAHTGKKGPGNFSVKQHKFELSQKYDLFSYKFNDWDYKRPDLPTYARGLFTLKNRFGKHEIAVRGYDKFFNIGEVRTTEWSHIKRHTRGPYTLSVKENGCIIFISGLEDGSLLVCSKHSTGTRDDIKVSHACAGEKWVERHIASVGRTKKELARALRLMNATLVAELCDDEFEEHVLAYTPEQAGLYVHGLNLNLPEFVTYPAHLVDKFADEWGMKKVTHITENDIDQVKAFLERVAKTGNYNGRDTEGFVIRCQARPTENAPYADWFFKYKFEEPYLMYRQWRECTKALISGQPPRYKKHASITKEYLDFARRKFIESPELAPEYAKNHGIIKLREEFLAFRGITGAEIISQEQAQVPTESEVSKRIVLVPVATIGCGKTTLALALAKLFDWGHFQNDNVQSKRKRPQAFADSVSSLLVTHPVVIADRNNHQKREREQLMHDVSRAIPSTRYVALHYVHDRPQYNTIREATRKRVLERGDNHQTIQAGSQAPNEIIGIMDGFVDRFQPVDPSNKPDDLFDTVINLDPLLDTRDNLQTVVAKMYETYPKLFQGKEMPTDADMDAAIEYALNDYRPSFNSKVADTWRRETGQMARGSCPKGQGVPIKSTVKPPESTKKRPQVMFFGVYLDTARVNAILDAIFANQDAKTAQMYMRLKQSSRIQDQFHVTLIHRQSPEENKPYWDQLHQLHTHHCKVGTPQAEIAQCNIHLERLVWDDRVMSFVVRLDGAAIRMSASSAGTDTLPLVTVNPVAHITVGTASPAIKPMESNAMLQQWLAEGSGGDTGIEEVVVPGNVVLQGRVLGTMSRF